MRAVNLLPADAARAKRRVAAEGDGSHKRVLLTAAAVAGVVVVALGAAFFHGAPLCLGQAVDTRRPRGRGGRRRGEGRGGSGRSLERAGAPRRRDRRHVEADHLGEGPPRPLARAPGERAARDAPGSVADSDGLDLDGRAPRRRRPRPARRRRRSPSRASPARSGPSRASSTGSRLSRGSTTSRCRTARGRTRHVAAGSAVHDRSEPRLHWR